MHKCLFYREEEDKVNTRWNRTFNFKFIRRYKVERIFFFSLKRLFQATKLTPCDSECGVNEIMKRKKKGRDEEEQNESLVGI